MRHNSYSRFRKKGSVLVEFIVCVPFFMLMTMFPLQTMFFSLSQTASQSAAIEGARYVSTELSGLKINSWSDPKLTSDRRQQITEGLIARVHSTSNHNQNLLLFRDSSNNPAAPVILATPSRCDDAFSNNSYKRVICVYIQSETVNSQPKAIVRVKAEHRVIGNLIPGLEGRLYAKGNGMSNINRPDRYQYY